MPTLFSFVPVAKQTPNSYAVYLECNTWYQVQVPAMHTSKHPLSWMVRCSASELASWIMLCSSFFFGSCGPQAAARLSSRIYYYVVRSTYAPAVVVSVWERILHCQTARGWWITRMWWWCTGWAGRSHISRTFRSASNVALWLWWWCGAISAGATAILAKLEEFSNWWKSQVLSNFY